MKSCGTCCRSARVAISFIKNSGSDAGVDIADIQTIDDLENLPLTHKQELMAAPEDFRLNSAGFALA